MSRQTIGLTEDDACVLRGAGGREQARADNADPRVRHRAAGHRIEPSGLRLCVVVEKDQKLALSLGGTEIARARKTEVGLGSNYPHTFIKIGQRCQWFRRGIVDHDDSDVATVAKRR